MISVTRLNNKEFYVNCDLIEFIEATPDTVITLTTGKKIVVEDDIDTIIGKIIKFKRKIYSDLPKTVKAENLE
jgi:flagellar protein FlbD